MLEAISAARSRGYDIQRRIHCLKSQTGRLCTQSCPCCPRTCEASAGGACADAAALAGQPGEPGEGLGKSLLREDVMPWLRLDTLRITPPDPPSDCARKLVTRLSCTPALTCPHGAFWIASSDRYGHDSKAHTIADGI